MELSSIIRPEAVRAKLKTSSKKRLLQDMSDVASSIYGLRTETVFESVQGRENLGPTGMGGGVAIPHARLSGLESVVGLFATLEKPIDYDAVDGLPVDLVFMLLAPEDAGAEHLRALARVSRLLRDDRVCGKLRSTEDTSALFAILTEPAASQAA